MESGISVELGLQCIERLSIAEILRQRVLHVMPGRRTVTGYSYRCYIVFFYGPEDSAFSRGIPMPTTKYPMSEKTTKPKPDKDDNEMKIKELDLESGWLGRVFGSPRNAPPNIAGVVVVCLVLIAGGISFFQKENALECWRVVAPIITMVLGYMFGKKP
jgi:hypothetical protein